jgi:hypothetical protein
LKWFTISSSKTDKQDILKEKALIKGRSKIQEINYPLTGKSSISSEHAESEMVSSPQLMMYSRFCNKIAKETLKSWRT